MLPISSSSACDSFLNDGLQAGVKRVVWRAVRGSSVESSSLAQEIPSSLVPLFPGEPRRQI